MIGEQYWANGIIATYFGEDQWGLQIDFLDDGFCNEESTQGSIKTRYITSLDNGIETLIKDAKKLGIKLNDDFILYAYQDGYSKDHPMPKNWISIFEKTCKKHNLTMIYKEKADV
jgi:hypothetical protein